MPSEPIIADSDQNITNPSFSFSAGSVAAERFDVLSFEGREQISQPYEYRLVVKFDGDTPPFDVVNKGATLMLGPTVIRGIVANFQVLREAEQLNNDNSRKLICEAVLVPKLWRLGLSQRSRVYKNGTVKGIVKEVLKSELSTSEYDFDAIVPHSEMSGASDTDAVDPYPIREFVTQYQETDLNFINRILEDAGIYYYFRAGRMIFCESRDQHVPVGTDDGSQQALIFTAAQGALLSNAARVFDFVANEQVVPRSFSVSDYDFETFERALDKSKNTSDSNDDPKRAGEQNEYGYHVPEKRGAEAVDGEGLTSSDLEALKREKRLERIALIRAEEIEAQRRKRTGKSNIPLIRPGHTFTLSSHFYVAGDETQLVTRVHHSYKNVRYRIQTDIEYDHDGDASTASLNLGDAETTAYELVYKNEFLCVPNDVQYRPPRVTEVPRIPGIMTARVKGNTEEGKAHLDSEGRYHIHLPFDSNPYDLTSCGPSSEPSRPVRLTQPYSGKDYGIHFPNQEGAEMVFAYLDGNPDRPLGLGTVPTPWNHTPVPNQKLKMRTQNPWSGALPFSGNDSYTIEDSLFYDENKNVIRTRLGHQIVMDDNDGGANVGITIQTGNTDPYTNKSDAEIQSEAEGDSAAEKRHNAWKERNKYWFSRIDMGGYRVKSGVEQIIDGATEVMGYLTTLASREFLQFASLALAVGKATAESGDYLSDTYGATTPVGVNIRTDQSINLNGANGVNIVSPNVFGMFSSSFVGDNKEQKIAQHYIENIYKATNSLIFQDIMNDTVDEFKEAAEVYDDHKKKGHSASKKKAFFKWKKQFKKARVKALVYTLLQRSGINIHSAGELKMSSLSSTTMVAGEGGVAIKSSGNIEQNASRGFEIDSHEGISISTKGRPYTGKAAADQALDFLGIIAPPLATFVKGITSKKASKDIADKDDRLPLALTNESGDITLNTQHKGDIFYHAEGGGNIIGLAERGRVLHRSSDEIVSEVGFKSPKPGPIHEPMEDADKGEDISIAKKAFDIWKDADEKKIEAYRKYKDAKYALTWKLKRVDRFPGLVASNAANRHAANAKFQLQSAIGSRIKQTQDAVEIFAQNGITINTVDDNSKAYIKIEKDESIEIVCGKSKVLLDKKGNITIDGKGDLVLKGKKVRIESKGQLQMKSKKLLSNHDIIEKKSKKFKNVTKLAQTDAKLAQAKANMTMIG